MAKILFVSAQLPGHLDWGGYLATAAALSERGHSILWASGREVEKLVTTAGVRFQALAETGWRWPPPPPITPDPSWDAAQLRLVRGERALDQWLDPVRVALACQEMIDLGHEWQPALIVSEIFVSAAGLAAEALAVPFAIAGWPAQTPKVSAETDPLQTLARQRLQRLLDHFALRGENWTSEGAAAQLSPHLHLTYWSPSWYRGLDLLPQTQHVGGRASAIAPAPSWPTDDPWVLITLGTSFGKDGNFFLNAAHAAAQIGCLPILALGGQWQREEVAALRGRLPRGSIVVAAVDFAAVLPRLAAAIHHGGAGTTHALVTHGVPQIIVPHAADQIHQAQGVTRSGVGLHLPAKEATVERLVGALAQILPDLAASRVNAERLRSEFAALGGPQRAADLLEMLIQ